MTGLTSLRPMDPRMEARQQEWLHRASKGGQIRVREDGEGQTTIYNAKRNFFGSAVSAIKDIGASDERAKTRSRATTEFQAFLYDRFGTKAAKHITAQLELGGRELRAKDVTAAIALGVRLESAGSSELERHLDLEALPREVRKGAERNNGFATPELVRAVLQDISSRSLGIDPDDISVRQLDRDGAATAGLFKVTSNGQSLFIKQTSIGVTDEASNSLFVLGIPQDKSEILRNDAQHENSRLDTLMKSEVGNFQPIVSEGGTTLDLERFAQK